jgi:SAM-dependent methyltransferase
MPGNMNGKLTNDDHWLLEHSERISCAISPEKSILELGCGSGRDTEHLCRFGFVIATDINHQGLQSINASSASRVRIDLSKPLPFQDRVFGFVLASLSLHYFSWTETEFIVAEIKRVLINSGNLLVRVNSTNDTNYGAGCGELIEENFFRTKSQRKRFFDLDSIEKLFWSWKIIQATEKEIDRYRLPKHVWEVVLLAD